MNAGFSQNEAQRIQGQLQLALNAFHQHDLQQARNICENLLVQFPQLLHARQLLGLIEMTEGHLDAALPHLKQCADEAPYEATFLVNYALALHQKQTSQEAQELLLRAASQDPVSPEPYYHLACIAQQQEKPDEMRKLLKQALERSPEFEPALALYRQSGAQESELQYFSLRGLLEQGHTELVLEQLEQACQQTPEADLLRSLYIEILLVVGKLPEAKTQLEALKDPHFLPALPWKAQILKEAGQDQAALELLKQYLKEKPDYWSHWQSLLNLLLRLGKTDLINQNYEEAKNTGQNSLKRYVFKQLLAPPEQQSLAHYLHAKLEHNLERLALRSETQAHREATEELLERLESPFNPPNMAELNHYLNEDRQIDPWPTQVHWENIALNTPAEDIQERFFAYQPHYIHCPEILPESIYKSLLNFRDQAYIWHEWLASDFALRADLSTGLWHKQWESLIHGLRQTFPGIIGDMPLLHFSAYQQNIKPDQRLEARPDFANARIKVFLELENAGEHIILDRAVPNFADNFLFERFRHDKTAVDTWIQTQVQRMYTIPCLANSLLLVDAEVPHLFRRQESAQGARLQRSGLELHFGHRHTPWPKK